MKVSKSLGPHEQTLKKSMLSGLASLCIGLSPIVNGSDDSVERFWPFEVENYSENPHPSYIPSIARPLLERKLADTEFLRKYELNDREAKDLVILPATDYCRLKKGHDSLEKGEVAMSIFANSLPIVINNSNPIRLYEKDIDKILEHPRILDGVRFSPSRIIEAKDHPDPGLEQFSLTSYFHKSNYVAGKELTEDSIEECPRIYHEVKRYESQEKLVRAVQGMRIYWNYAIRNYENICAFNLEDKALVSFYFLYDSRPEKEITLTYLDILKNYFQRNNLNMLDRDKDLKVTEEEFYEKSNKHVRNFSKAYMEHERRDEDSAFYERIFEWYFD